MTIGLHGAGAVVIFFLMLFAAVAQTTFSILYLRSPWWRTPLGRVIMGNSWALSLFLNFSLVAAFVPEFRWADTSVFLRALLHVFILAAVAVSSISMIILLAKYQAFDPEHDQEETVSGS